MASLNVVSAPFRVGQMVAAWQCDASSALGRFNKKTATPVQVRLVNQDLLFVDDEPRPIIQTIIVGDETRFFITGKPTPKQLIGGHNDAA
jgi:hypothetical protein